MTNFIKIAGIVTILSVFIFAQEANTEDVGNNITVNADSIRAEIERLTAQLQQSEQTQTIETKIEPATEDIENSEIAVDNETDKTPKKENSESKNNYLYSSNKKDVSFDITRDDTTFTIIKVKTDKRNSIHTTDTTIRIIKINPSFFENDNLKNNTFGIGGGVALGAIYMDMKPIKNLYREEVGLNPIFDNREPMFLIGGFGFGGFVNGVRAGGGGYSANAEYRARKTGTDTMIVTNVNIGYGGVIIGRAWSKDKNTFHFQTLIGAGKQDVEIQAQKARGTGLSDLIDNTMNNILPKDYFQSKFFACDFEFGYTKSIMQWFHISGEISGLFMYSRSGFDIENYTSISPTAKVRFVFGSLR